MPQITINGRKCEFEKGQMILQVALDNEIEIPHYCYHPGLSIPANCRICLAEVWAPNPRRDNRLEPVPKLIPTCQTAANDGQVVSTESPKAIANQKAVMEYLLINHPVDCPVCDQAGECYLQDYSYQYGRSASRFQEAKIKQPKKDLGPHVLLYADRCIMCTRCVRFTREVTGTGELMVDGRGSTSQIDVFPGVALDNELSGNVVDICPVGALLDKEFLFAQRVWFLKSAPSIDGITASGDNIWIEHNEGKLYRVRPRTNLDVNKWWITDEVRYGWKFVHGDDRLRMPRIRSFDPFEPADAPRAFEAAYGEANRGVTRALETDGRLAVLISPMLSSEDAYHLALYALEVDPDTLFSIGPVPRHGEDKTFPGGFTMFAEKAPNARGVRRVLSHLSENVVESPAFAEALERQSVRAVLVTGNYPSAWVTPKLQDALRDRFVVLIDTLESALAEAADVVIPGATWAEKAGTFENARNRLQAFERAIAPVDFCKSEAQIALDLLADRLGGTPAAFHAHQTRDAMAEIHGMGEFVSDVSAAPAPRRVESEMQVVEL